MESLHDDLNEYRAQMQKGAIQRAYRGLMEYILGLKTHFKERCPECFVSGGLYPGYMDMTYFSVMPESLKARGLKVAVVFLHSEFRFEVWLGGYNKQVQAQYWKRIKESGWDRYPILSSLQGEDAILTHILAQDPDFTDPAALTERIEQGTLTFIRDVEEWLEKHS